MADHDPNALVCVKIPRALRKKVKGLAVDLEKTLPEAMFDALLAGIPKLEAEKARRAAANCRKVKTAAAAATP